MARKLPPTTYHLPPTRPRASRGGFTLIEMLIVIVISAMLSTIAIGYSTVGRDTVALSVEEATISQAILQAKSLAIATYGASATTPSAGSDVCAYGVSFNVAAQTYSVFAYTPPTAPPCPSDATIANITANDTQEYTAGTWNVHISNGVLLYSGTSGDGLVDVLFYPPNPDTFISRDGNTFMNPTETSKVYLKTVDGSASATISVSSAGQVTF